MVCFEEKDDRRSLGLQGEGGNPGKKNVFLSLSKAPAVSYEKGRPAGSGKKGKKVSQKKKKVTNLHRGEEGGNRKDLRRKLPAICSRQHKKKGGEARTRSAKRRIGQEEGGKGNLLNLQKRGLPIKEEDEAIKGKFRVNKNS